MGFQQGLSGLNAADKDLQVIGNNVANSNTVGFKSSTAQFADVYANSLGGGGNSQVGIGVTVAAVSEQFAQGNISTTNNPLDLAINGQGFYRISAGNAISYTRDGQFKLDKNGYIVNSLGQNLTGYSAVNGVVTPGALGNLQISSASLPPKATSTTTIGANLSSSATAPTASGSFSPTDPTSYNFSIPETLYDSLGQTHAATFYFVNAAPNTWNVYTTLDGTSVNGTQTNSSQLSAALSTAAAAATAAGATASQITAIQSAISTAAASPPVTSAALGAAASGAATSPALTSTQASTIAGAVDMVPNSGSAASMLLQFNSAGSITGTASGSLTVNLTNGAAPLTFTEDFSKVTQYGGSFGTNSLVQDGYTAGQLSNYSIGKDGLISGSYSNGQTQILGQVALANFTAPNELTDLGNNQYGETLASGSALIGPPGTASLGVLQSSAVEGSNVDLTAELVNLISAQRNYQANAQSIKAEDTVLQTIVSGL
ncbi:MAG: flagellar hook protein FlgE [Burkholderiales bacterium]